MEVPSRVSISSGSSSKRARALATGTNETSNVMTTQADRAAKGANFSYCLVDGCNADLSACRDYHRRHKVCETHSKTPKVTISGREQRFCQQCSRFHSLVEFDEWKRSCRKRLDGHNRRRRKPPPPPRNSSSLLSFGGSPPQMLQASSNDHDHDHDHDHDMLMFYNQQQLIDKNCHESSSLLMLQSQPPPESSHIQMNMFDDDSDHGALSLLSSPSASTLSHLTSTHHPQHDSRTLPQNSFYSPSTPYDYPPSTQQYCVSDASAQDLFQHGPPRAGSPTTAANGSHQTQTFVWE